MYELNQINTATHLKFYVDFLLFCKDLVLHIICHKDILNKFAFIFINSYAPLWVYIFYVTLNHE